jgi:hypothetical protein
VSAQEVEDLIPKVQMLNDSYRGIREAVLSSTTSASGDDNKEVVRLVMHNGYGHEVNGYSDDSKNFGPPDSKKRRGVCALGIFSQVPANVIIRPRLALRRRGGAIRATAPRHPSGGADPTGPGRSATPADCVSLRCSRRGAIN